MKTVFAATVNGLHVLGKERLLELEGEHVSALAHDADGRLLALFGGHSLSRRSPDGSWEVVATYNGHRLNCAMPVGDTLLAGTSEAHLVRIYKHEVELVEGFESAGGRSAWFTPWGGPPDVRSLARGENGEIYANVHVGGILRSDDSARSWNQTISIHNDVHEVVAGPEGLVVAAGARGLSISPDGGGTWRLLSEGLHAGYCRAVAICGGWLLVTACVGPHGGRAALYRTALRDGGELVKCESGLPAWFSDNIDTGCLATSGTSAAFGTSDGQLFVSEDEGREWVQIAVGLPPIQAVLLT